MDWVSEAWWIATGRPSGVTSMTPPDGEDHSDVGWHRFGKPAGERNVPRGS